MFRWLAQKLWGVDPADVSLVFLAVWGIVFAAAFYLAYKIVTTKQIGAVAGAVAGRGR